LVLQWIKWKTHVLRATDLEELNLDGKEKRVMIAQGSMKMQLSKNTLRVESLFERLARSARKAPA